MSVGQGDGGFSLGDAISQTHAIAPTLSSQPAVALAASQANISTTNTEQVAAYTRGLELERFISGQDPTAQQSFYNSLGADDQKLLMNMGYQLPAEKHKSRSLWGDVTHIASNVGHALGAPLRFVQHLNRAGELDPAEYIYSPGWGKGSITQELGNGQSKTTGYASIWHPSSFVRAWRATSNGRRAFDTKVLQVAQQKYDPKTFEYALRFAEDGPQEAIHGLAGVDPAKYQDVINTTNTEDFKNALTDIRAAQITPGHDLANTLGLKPGTTAFKDVSGSADAYVDWFGDPTLGLGKLTKVAKVAKYGIAAADQTKVERMMQSTTAQRGWSYITDRLNIIKDDAAGPGARGQALADIRNNFPSVVNLVDPLIQHAKGLGEDVNLGNVTDYLSSADGKARMLSGLASREAPLLPGRLSKFGEAQMAVSDGLHAAIDFLTDGRKYIPYDQIGQTPEEAKVLGEAAFDYRKSLGGRLRYSARRLTTRIPRQDVFDATAPTAVDTIRKVAMTYLPTARANQIAAAFAGADLGGKRAVYEGMLDELGHASGITMSSTGSEWWADLMNKVRASGKSLGTYSPVQGAFVRDTGGGQRALGGLADHMTTKWSLPSFKEMQANAARIGIADRVFGGLNKSFVDGLMGKWRFGVLFRPAFAVRNSMSELFNSYLRGNGFQLLRSRVASSLSAQAAPGEVNSALMRTVARVAESGTTLMSGIPLSNASDFGTAYILGKMRAGLSNIYQKIDPEAVNYIRDGLQSPTIQRAMEDSIEGVGRNASHSMESGDVEKAVEHKGVRWRPDGEFHVTNADGLQGAMRWSHNLEQIGNDAVAWHIAMNPYRSFDDIKGDLLDIMHSPHYQDVVNKAEIADITKDGRRVSLGQATQDEALTDWAKDIYDHTQALITDAKGNYIKPLVDHISKNPDNVNPGISFLNKLTQRPAHVLGPEFVAMPGQSWLQSLADRGWHNLVSRPMNFLSRQPIFWSEYIDARKAFEPQYQELVARGMSEDNALQLVREKAEMVAHDRAIKFIHDPKLRSQFSVIARNMFPFRHAEESALQRYTNAFVHSPESIRRAQLMMEGLRHSGIVTNDSSGNAYVVMPGTGALLNLLPKIANILPGVHMATFPIYQNLGFQLKFVDPFLAQFGDVGTGNNAFETGLSAIHPLIPPSGPLLAMPLTFLNRLFPESRLAQDAKDVFINKQGQSKPLWQEFVPTAVSRFYQAIGQSDDRNGQLASATKNAIQYLEAAGLTPGADATPDQVDQYLNRVRSWARNFLVMRSIFGVVSPAAPDTPQFAPKADYAFQLEGIKSVSDEFYKLTATMPFQDALATFIKLHPDDSPFTVSQSKSPSGAQMSSTTKTLNWMDAHSGLLKRYPLSAPFLMPEDPGTFNSDAYKEQLAAGVRQKKSISEFYNDLKVRHASDEYFAARDARDAAVQVALGQGNKNQAKAIEAGFHDWSQQFQGTNPLFAQYLANGSQRQLQKEQSIAELQAMVDNGDINSLVDKQTAQGVAQMVDAWRSHLEFTNALYGRNDGRAVAMRKAEQQTLGDYLRGVAKANPSLQSIFNQLFAPFTA